MSDLTTIGTAEQFLTDLRNQPSERIAEAADLIAQEQERLSEMAARLEAELRVRLAERGRRQMQAGEWQVRIEGGNGRETVWDADELEDKMRILVDSGVLRASECVGVIKREPVVSREAAKALAARLDGQARALIESCYEWRKKKGRGKLNVVRLVPLISEGDDERV